MNPSSPNRETTTSSERNDPPSPTSIPSNQRLTGVLERARHEGPPLAYRYDPAAGEAQGSVLILHGYGEHYRRYDEVAEAWVRHGLAVVRFDLRGHGHSGGLRGHIDAFRDYIRDALEVLARVRSRQNLPEPLFVFGHSLGGLIACHFALEHQAQLRALLLSSPFTGLLSPVPDPVLDWCFHRVSPLFPHLRLPSGLKGSKLTHDRERIERYDTDPLGFTHVTLGWLDQVRRAQGDLLNASPHLTLPVLCLAAGQDRAVDLSKTEALFRRLGSRDKQLRVLPGLFHEILNETSRTEHIQTFAKAMVGWLPR